MDFRFNADQLALQSAAQSFCDDRLTLDSIGQRESAPVDQLIWDGLAELGVLGMLAQDGDDIGIVEAAIVFEVLGSHLIPGPVLWSTLSASLVAGVDEGRVRVTGVEATSGARDVAVPHADESDLVVALYDDRVEVLDTSRLRDGEVGLPLDPLTPMVVYPSLPTGAVAGDQAAADRLHLLGAVLAASLLVGLAQGALDTARAYALEREQFDRPIGSFQAIKHLLADMFVRVELARSATYAAAALIADARAGDGVRATSSAKLLAGEAAIANGRAGVQILGGMGFTWDMLPHYFLKRAWVLENTFGTGTTHSHRLADAVEAEVLA